MKNKKGYMNDILFFGIIMLILSITILAGAKIGKTINTDIQNSSMSADAKSIMADNINRYDSVFDWIFFGVFILFAIFIFASMYMLNTNSAMFFIVMIIFAFILVAVGIMANSYDAYETGADLNTYSANLPVMDWLMNHLVESALVIGFVGIIVLFAKIKLSGG